MRGVAARKGAAAPIVNSIQTARRKRGREVRHNFIRALRPRVIELFEEEEGRARPHGFEILIAGNWRSFPRGGNRRSFLFIVIAGELRTRAPSPRAPALNFHCTAQRAAVKPGPPRARAGGPLRPMDLHGRAAQPRIKSSTIVGVGCGWHGEIHGFAGIVFRVGSKEIVICKEIR